MTDVTRWLEELGLGQYGARFRENDIEFDVLQHLTDEDLKELGLSLGHRKKILAAIHSLSVGHLNLVEPVREETQTSLLEDAERRQLTIMFCDLVGSTELSQMLDPEDLRDISRMYQHTCKDSIEQYEGFVARYMGDGLLAYFGYPKAHEDDAERAIHAGLEIIKAIADLNNSLGKEVKLAVRIGVATGLVVVGDLIGEGASEESPVVGQTPNLAARLQGLAKENTIVISPQTYKLAGESFECQDLGSHKLKGFTDPVNVWEVTNPAKASRFDTRRRKGLTPLVGREEEIKLLLRRWEQLNEGEGQVVLLSGEPGIGKSRITQTMRDRISEDPHIRLSYQCSPYHTNTAWHPIVEQLIHAAQLHRDDSVKTQLGKLEVLLAQSARNVEEVIPLFAELLSIPLDEHRMLPDLLPERKKEKTLEALVTQLQGLSEHQPVFMVFEDVHWADPTSLELLELIIDKLQLMKVLLVITFRPEFTPPWTGFGHVTSLTLNRFNRGLVTAMIERVTRGKPLPDEVREHIADKTDGIPLFVEELTKTLLESDVLTEESHRYVISESASKLSVPVTLRDSLVARLDRLTSAKEVAQVASVIGREFPYDLLTALSPLSDSNLQEALTELTETGLVFSRGTTTRGSYVFKHALVQDAAYESLLRSKRKELHAQVANALKIHFPERGETEPELIALHLTKADQWEQAIVYWQLAGKRAISRSANLEAIAHFSQGLELLPDDSKTEEQTELKLDLLLGLGEALARAGDAEKSKATFLKAAELSRSLKLKEPLAHAALGYGGRFVWEVARGDPHLVPLLQEALTVLGKENSALRAKLLARLAGGPLRDAVDRKPRARLSEEAVEIARRLGDPETFAYVLDGRYAAVWWPDNLEQRIRISTELIEQAVKANDKERALQGHHYRLLCFLERGDMDRVYDELSEKGHLAEELQQPSQRWYVAAVHATLAIFEGRFEEADKLIIQAQQEGKRAQGANADVALMFHLYMLRREQSRLEEVEEMISTSIEKYPTYHVLHCVLVHLYMELGKRNKVRDLFNDLARDDFKILPRNEEWLFGMSFLPDVASYLDDKSRAEILYHQLLPYAERNAVSAPDACSGSVARCLGVAATTMTRWDDAERHFDDALTMNLRTRTKTWVAWTQYNYAQMLMAKSKSNKAKDLLKTALDTAHELGMANLETRLLALVSSSTAKC